MHACATSAKAGRSTRRSASPLVKPGANSRILARSWHRFSASSGSASRQRDPRGAKCADVAGVAVVRTFARRTALPLYFGHADVADVVFLSSEREKGGRLAIIMRSPPRRFPPASSSALWRGGSCRWTVSWNNFASTARRPYGSSPSSSPSWCSNFASPTARRSRHFDTRSHHCSPTCSAS